MASLLRRYGLALTFTLLMLAAFWMLVLVWLPYSIMIEQSFRPYLAFSELGGPKDVYSAQNYLSLFDTSATKDVFGLQMPMTIYIFLQTILFSCLVTVICVVLAYPLAYALAKRVATSTVPTLFLLLLVPMLVSEFLRTFAWYIVLAYQGPLNAIIGLVGLKPVRWISGYNGIMVGMVYTYVLFMFFPIYNSLTALDTNQIEAAQDLGAPWWRIHLHVVLPHAKTGISSGSTMVFMFAVGSILVPVLLGSPSSRWFTEIIQRTMFESQDWNTASAYAFLLLLVCVAFVTLMMRIFRVQLSDMNK